jgi:hypothetical protein
MYGQFRAPTTREVVHRLTGPLRPASEPPAARPSQPRERVGGRGNSNWSPALRAQPYAARSGLLA